MCSETDFTQEKVNFHATTLIPTWHEKCIFEALHNDEIKYVLSVKKSIFTFAYGQPDCKISVFLQLPFYHSAAKKQNVRTFTFQQSFSHHHQITLPLRSFHDKQIVNVNKYPALVLEIANHSSTIISVHSPHQVLSSHK